jgi:hypothetical protein
MSHQEILGALAFLISLIGTIVYIRSIFKNESKPHFYTWLVFAILTLIAFAAQLADNAGPGAWMMGMTAVSCSTISLLSLKYGETSRTRGDKICLATALLAILPWFLTKNPLISVLMISAIDGIAMIPTIRKSWHQPYQENLLSYALANLKNLISLFALLNFTMTTALYPVSVCLINSTLIAVCLYRRRYM